MKIPQETLTLYKIDSLTGDKLEFRITRSHSVIDLYEGFYMASVLKLSFNCDTEKKARASMQIYIEKLIKEGWTDRKSGVPLPSSPLPMLAYRFEKYAHKITYPCWVQPKLDGFRCIAVKDDKGVTCWSRLGNQFETTSHIEAELNNIMEDGEVWDGELYKHGISFEKTSGHIKNLKVNSNIIEYHVYDFINKEDQLSRLQTLQIKIETKFVKFVFGYPADKAEDIFAWFNLYIDRGYEGAIVRDKNNLYRENYRSPFMLKVKKFHDSEFEIIDYGDGDGKEEGLVIWTCKTLEGGEFRVRPQGSYGDRKRLFDTAHAYIGKMLTVRYFSLGKKGVPRFPIGIRIKEEM